MIKHFAIIDEKGAVISVCGGDKSYFADEIKGRHTVDLSSKLSLSGEGVYYYDFKDETIKHTLPPSPFCVFNYDTVMWEDKRSTDELKLQKWSQLKLERDTFEFGGFTYNGNVYDSDQVSQARILTAVASGLTQSWTTADNSVIELTTDEVQALANSMQAHISEAHELGRIAREAINAAQTIEEIEAVTL